MNILGINYFFHDSTACIVSDGRLIVAIEEERLSRDKHTTAFPQRSIERCLQLAGLTHGDIDAVAVSIQPQKDMSKKILYGLKTMRHAGTFVKHEVLVAARNQLRFREWYRKAWPGKDNAPPVYSIPHHLSHAAGSFLVSPYEKADILSLDGSGEWSTTFLGKGEGTSITQFNESYFPMSLGSFYEAATQFCGFRPNYDEGKTMGLAPMGDPERFYDQAAKLLDVDDEGKLSIDLSYFNYQHWGHKRFNERFEKLFGSPRHDGEEFLPHHMDLAAAFQLVLEEAALKMCRVLRQKSGSDHLVIAGGVALNSVMNGRIVRESDYEDLYVMPAAGDNGTAIGAAIYLDNTVLGNERRYYHHDPYVGNEYTNDQIEATLKECKLDYEKYENIEDVAAKMLHEGQIIGWFQGKMEIGPRALGNRSILANPTMPGMKDKINAEVKHREAYRPFAPSAIVEQAGRFFEDLGDNPFMLKVCNVLPEMRDRLPAITHVDGSARLQTVHKEINPRYHALISKLGELNDTPVVLNTSFNIMGEPIVESPLDAIRCFYSTGLDSLVVGNFLLRK